MKKDVIRMTDKAWSGNMWSRIRAILTGHESRIDALEQGGGGGGGAVSGVKGDAESTYRTGNVNLTPANIGALPSNTTFVSGVKGDAESSYRSGNVNLTPANVGALALTGGVITGNLSIRRNEVDGTKSDNGIESNLYPGYIVTDKNYNWLMVCRASILTDGTIGAGISLRNYINSEWVEKYVFTMLYGKDGSVSYSIQEIPFRKALGLGTDGALPITVGQGGTGATTSADARDNISVAQRIEIAGSGFSTWANVFAALQTLDQFKTADIYVEYSKAAIFTDSKISGVALFGTVLRGTSTYYFMLRNTAAKIYGVNISNASASSRTTTVYEFTGTVL